MPTHARAINPSPPRPPLELIESFAGLATAPVSDCLNRLPSLSTYVRQRSPLSLV